MKKSKLFALAALIAALLCGCTASVDPSVTPSPSVEPTPEPTPRVLLEYGACGEYEMFAQLDSPEVRVSMRGASTDEAVYTFKLDGVETPEEPRRLYHAGTELPEVDGTVYSLYRRDSSVTTNHVDMIYSVLVSDDEQIAFIDDLLASAEFHPIPDEQLEFENRLCLYVETESGLTEYQIGIDGLLLRLSEPLEFAKGEITYEAAEVDAEAAAYLHMIEWANRAFPTDCRDEWVCLDDPEPADYRMCVVGEQLHMHLTVDEAKEFVKAFDPDLPQSRDVLSASKLGWSGYDGYMIVDEYTRGVDAPAKRISHHILFRDGSVASWLDTHDAVMHYAGANSTFIVFDSNFPRAGELSGAGVIDYDAACAWIEALQYTTTPPEIRLH